MKRRVLFRLFGKRMMSKFSKPWGNYEILYRDDGYQVKKLVIKPEKSISLQMHFHREELWYVISGNGAFFLNGESFVGGPGTVFKVLPEDRHQVVNISKTEDFVAIEIWRGELLSEDDIMRV